MFPTLFAVFFGKGATKAGAVASIIAGTVTTLLWKEVGLPASLTGSIDEVLPAITVSVICLVVFSKLKLGAKSKE